MAVLPDLVLMVTLAVCLYTDLKERRIYNKVLFPAAAAGMIFYAARDGLSGLKFSAAGLGLGLLLFFVPYALGGLGAGDVKLLGAVGALKGPLFVFHAALGTALAGGVIALGILFWRRQIWTTFRRLALACGVLLVGKRSAAAGPLLMLERNPYSSLFPYGAAIFLGTLMAYWFGNFLPAWW